MAAHSGDTGGQCPLRSWGTERPSLELVQPVLGEAAVNPGTSLDLRDSADFLTPRHEFLHLTSNTDEAGEICARLQSQVNGKAERWQPSASQNDTETKQKDTNKPRSSLSHEDRGPWKPTNIYYFLLFAYFTNSLEMKVDFEELRKKW